MAKKLVKENKTIVGMARSLLRFGNDASKQPFNNAVTKPGSRNPARQPVFKKAPRRK